MSYFPIHLSFLRSFPREAHVQRGLGYISNLFFEIYLLSLPVAFREEQRKKRKEKKEERGEKNKRLFVSLLKE